MFGELLFEYVWCGVVWYPQNPRKHTHHGHQAGVVQLLVICSSCHQHLFAKNDFINQDKCDLIIGFGILRTSKFIQMVHNVFSHNDCEQDFFPSVLHHVHYIFWRLLYCLSHLGSTLICEGEKLHQVCSVSQLTCWACAVFDNGFF